MTVPEKYRKEPVALQANSMSQLGGECHLQQCEVHESFMADGTEDVSAY